MDNLSEYRDPSEYDCEYGNPEPELSFYSNLARLSGNPILEIACGTGRIAIPLALQGFEVTGIDISKDMIKEGVQKSKGSTLKLIVADCRNFNLKQRFRLVYMTGNAFQALLSCADQEMLLQKIRQHLAPEGLFAFDTRFPSLSELSKVSMEEYWHTYKNPKGLSIRVSGYHNYDPIHQIAEYTTFRRWKEEGYRDKIRETKISLRYTFPLEMEALLHFNGFRIEKKFGDWDESVLNAESKKMIYICKLK